MLSKLRLSPLVYLSVSSIAPRVAAFSKTTSSFSSKATGGVLGKTLVSVRDAIGLHGEGDDGKNVRFIDGTWWLDKSRNGRQEFENGPRISRARYLDIDDVSTTTPDNLPHMMPSFSLQGAAMDAMGISKSDHVIVYGRENCMFVSRAYMQMRIMGHPQELCHLMDGSLQEWIDAGGPIEDVGTHPNHPVIDATNLNNNDETTYEATGPNNVISMEELGASIAEGKTQGQNPSVLVVDSRNSGRFTGVAPEPRPGLRSGHMPGAKNLPIVDLLDPDEKVKFKSKEDLQKIIQEAGISLPLDSNTKIVSSCGSGVTACALMTAFDILGEDSSEVYLYDGAWTEWGAQPDTPIVTD